MFQQWSPGCDLSPLNFTCMLEQQNCTACMHVSDEYKGNSVWMAQTRRLQLGEVAFPFHLLVQPLVKDLGWVHQVILQSQIWTPERVWCKTFDVLPSNAELESFPVPQTLGRSSSSLAAGYPSWGSRILRAVGFYYTKFMAGREDVSGGKRGMYGYL